MLEASMMLFEAPSTRLANPAVGAAFQRHAPDSRPGLSGRPRPDPGPGRAVGRRSLFAEQKHRHDGKAFVPFGTSQAAELFHRRNGSPAQPRRRAVPLGTVPLPPPPPDGPRRHAHDGRFRAARRPRRERSAGCPPLWRRHENRSPAHDRRRSKPAPIRHSRVPAVANTRTSGGTRRYRKRRARKAAPGTSAAATAAGPAAAEHFRDWRPRPLPSSAPHPFNRKPTPQPASSRRLVPSGGVKSDTNRFSRMQTAFSPV